MTHFCKTLKSKKSKKSQDISAIKRKRVDTSARGAPWCSIVTMGLGQCRLFKNMIRAKELFLILVCVTSGFYIFCLIDVTCLHAYSFLKDSFCCEMLKFMKNNAQF